MLPKKPPFKIPVRPALTVLAVVSAAGFIALADLSARARSAVVRAERLDFLARNPGERRRALEGDFLKGVAALDRRRETGAAREIALDVLRKRREEALLRPAWAEAYHAWKDVYDLYAPPETGRVRRARHFAAGARQRWREEWTARKIPFDESLLDLQADERDGYRLVASTRDGREASRALGVLQALDVPARTVPAARGPDGIRLLVPEDRFWEAHDALASLVGLDEK